jgi:hypothetical protein
MKKYVVIFKISEGKIPMIKLVRNLTSLGLREAKEFVEDKVNNFMFDREIEVIVTETNLGKFLINNIISPASQYTLINVVEYVDNKIIDLSEVGE